MINALGIPQKWVRLKKYIVNARGLVAIVNNFVQYARLLEVNENMIILSKIYIKSLALF